MIQFCRASLLISAIFFRRWSRQIDTNNLIFFRCLVFCLHENDIKRWRQKLAVERKKALAVTIKSSDDESDDGMDISVSNCLLINDWSSYRLYQWWSRCDNTNTKMEIYLSLKIVNDIILFYSWFCSTVIYKQFIFQWCIWFFYVRLISFHLFNCKDMKKKLVIYIKCFVQQIL